MLEGGAAGTVNMRSARPFDNSGHATSPIRLQGLDNSNADRRGARGSVIASGTWDSFRRPGRRCWRAQRGAHDRLRNDRLDQSGSDGGAVHAARATAPAVATGRSRRRSHRTPATVSHRARRSTRHSCSRTTPGSRSSRSTTRSSRAWAGRPTSSARRTATARRQPRIPADAKRCTSTWTRCTARRRTTSSAST